MPSILHGCSQLNLSGQLDYMDILRENVANGVPVIQATSRIAFTTLSLPEHVVDATALCAPYLMMLPGSRLDVLKLDFGICGWDRVA